MSDDEPSLDDVAPADVVSEELLILLHQQTQALETLIDQQEAIVDALGPDRDAVEEELVEDVPDALPSFY